MYLGLRNHYSELFTWMVGLKFLNAVAQPLLQLLLSLLQTQHFLPSRTSVHMRIAVHFLVIFNVLQGARTAYVAMASLCFVCT